MWAPTRSPRLTNVQLFCVTLYGWCTVVTEHWKMMNPRLKMSHEGTARVRNFHLRIIIFQCRTNDRASYVLSYRQTLAYKKLSYRRVTARCVLSVVILPIATQQCRNYLYDKSWPNWWYEVGGLVGGNVSWTMCTQPWRDRVSSHCLRCHKQTDDGRIVYITCIPMTCCGEIF